MLWREGTGIVKVAVAEWKREGQRDNAEPGVAPDRGRQHGNGYLAFRMNVLVDKDGIQALYRASQAGVQVDLQVGGICCLRLGAPASVSMLRSRPLSGAFWSTTRSSGTGPWPSPLWRLLRQASTRGKAWGIR